ncbi:unnamed protein product [Amaranthus hypochondriacus]
MESLPLSAMPIFAKSKVQEKYVFPPEKRLVTAGKMNIPIIDFHDDKNLIHQIMTASRDFGVFQVINHGVSLDLMNDAMNIFNKIFDLPLEERFKINKKDDLNQVCRYYSSSVNYNTEEFHFWREILKHKCEPIKECIKYWPQNPKEYREIIGSYVIALKDMSKKILELISQGLGLEEKYFENDLSKEQLLTINHYPKCPDPSVTIGLPKHKDPTILNILQVAPIEVPGLQFLKDGQWFGIDTSPNAFLIFIGNQLEVISNGNLKSAVHRVMNATKARTSSVFFTSPSSECIIEPAKILVQGETPLYKSFKYKEYLDIHIGNDGDRDAILEQYGFKIKY